MFWKCNSDFMTSKSGLSMIRVLLLAALLMAAASGLPSAEDDLLELQLEFDKVSALALNLTARVEVLENAQKNAMRDYNTRTALAVSGAAARKVAALGIACVLLGLWALSATGGLIYMLVRAQKRRPRSADMEMKTLPTGSSAATSGNPIIKQGGLGAAAAASASSALMTPSAEEGTKKSVDGFQDVPLQC